MEGHVPCEGNWREGFRRQSAAPIRTPYVTAALLSSACDFIQENYSLDLRDYGITPGTVESMAKEMLQKGLLDRALIDGVPLSEYATIKY